MEVDASVTTKATRQSSNGCRHHRQKAVEIRRAVAPRRVTSLNGDVTRRWLPNEQAAADVD